VGWRGRAGGGDVGSICHGRGPRESGNRSSLPGALSDPTGSNPSRPISYFQDRSFRGPRQGIAQRVNSPRTPST
jgi:hypothetical protein